MRENVKMQFRPSLAESLVRTTHRITDSITDGRLHDRSLIK